MDPAAHRGGAGEDGRVPNPLCGGGRTLLRAGMYGGSPAAEAGNPGAGPEAGGERGFPVLPPLLPGEPAQGIQGGQAGHRHGQRRAGAGEPQAVQSGERQIHQDICKNVISA